MVKKLSWFLLVLLIVMAIVVTSCDTKTIENGENDIIEDNSIEDEEPPAPETETPEDTTREEKPRYGGIAVGALSADILGFDEAFQNHTAVTTLHLTNEELLQGDWTKGPAGSSETNFIAGAVNKMDLKTGCLADSWEIPERGKMIFHIREGVHWHSKAPCNGRELTVEDVVFSLERVCTEPSSYIKITYPYLCSTMKITGDESTRMVTIECPESEWVNAVSLFPDFVTIMPKDAIEEFGHMNDWYNSIGTGAFMLTDYVSNGSATLIRNPNYWETNPIGPGKGDQLPYLDGVKLLVISDMATRMAAMRTGKIDGTSGEYDDVKEFLDNPDIKQMMFVSDTSSIIAMRTDKSDSMFSKKEVRQALYYATDFNMIKDEYYGGKAVILNWPLSYSQDKADAYVAMENLPANVQELFSHNIDKAKDLLTAAGYPTGFNVNIICYNTPTHVDFLSLIKQMWADVGINLTVDAKDYNIWVGRVRLRNYGTNELLYAYSAGVWQKMLNFSGRSQYNASYVDDPVVAEAASQINNYIGIDEDKLAEINAELMPYVIEQCWVLSKPSPYSYVIWWPWVKNWNGEFNVGYYNYPSYQKYRWLDADLRYEMTGKY